MKYLLAQPANVRFQWELDVALTNIRSLDEDTPIVVLFLNESPTSYQTIEHFKGRYRNVEMHAYHDERTYINYPPTVRPYLVWKYLSEEPSRELEDYFQIDSDVIFRELPDFSKMPLEGRVCWASDCSGYLGYDYLSSKKLGPQIIGKFASILEVPVETIEKTPGVGAQWYMAKPTAELWYRIWKDSQALYDYLTPLNSDIQKWTAEMWAQLYTMAKFGWEMKPAPELGFCRPTDGIEKWGEVKILHNAGVMVLDSANLFFKGRYDRKPPFGEKFDWVDPSKASKKYAEAVSRVYNNNNV